jgi:hypothetical protein
MRMQSSKAGVVTEGVPEQAGRDTDAVPFWHGPVVRGGSGHREGSLLMEAWAGSLSSCSGILCACSTL